MQRQSDNPDFPEKKASLVPIGTSSWMFHTFRSLKSYNYRIYAMSQLVSSCGSWIQLTAISWLVFDLTNSAFYLGLVSFLRQSPMLLLGFAGGWLADHVDRKRILISTKVVMLLQASLLAWLTISGHINILYMLLLATCLGITNAVDMPAKQSLTFSLVDRKDLVNAVSLNTSSFHAARTLGPVIAVGIVALLGNRTGEAVCFGLNAASFLAVIYALSRIKLKALPSSGQSQKSKKEIGLGKAFNFAFKTKAVREVLILGAVSSFLCMQYLVLLPVIAKTMLGRAIDGYGLLLACAASGSFLAAITLANKGKEGAQMQRFVLLAALGFASAIVFFALSNHILISCLIAVVLGFCSTSQLSGSNSLVQLTVDDELRGRVLSLWVMLISGMGPLGGLVVGWSATVYGAQRTLLCCGILAFVICGLLAVLSRRKSPECAT